MFITSDQLKQFHEDGYLVLESIINEADLTALREECDRQLGAQLADMERTGAVTLGLSHKEKRYSIATDHHESLVLQRFLFGSLMREIVKAILGERAYLFLELFAIKPPRTGIPLGWHQDSGYQLGLPHKPFLSLWCALDEMTEVNGTLAVLPFSRMEKKEVTRHVKDKATNDFVGYFGDDAGVTLCVPAGSIIVMSSLTFHRSGANITDQARRAFLAAYSPEPITDQKGNLWNQAVPLFEGMH